MGLDKLLYLQGVGAEFINCDGENVHIDWQDRLGMLQCMCADLVEQPEKVLENPFLDWRIEQLDAHRWTQVIQPFQWCYQDTICLDVYLPAHTSTRLKVSVDLENGKHRPLTFESEEFPVIGDYRIGGKEYWLRRVQMPAKKWPLGYHKVCVTADCYPAQQFSGTWMIAPRSAYNTQSIGLDNQSKRWGISLQLYSVKSRSPWQIGDFRDLQDILRWLAKYQADFVLLNPLHALDIAAPQNPSPYSPCDRRFINPLYISIESLPEYQFFKQEMDAYQALDSDAEWLDYEAIFQIKYELLLRAYDLFLHRVGRAADKRRQAYQQFCQQQGQPLLDFTAAELAHAPGWLAVQRQEFFAFVQFVADEQLAQSQALAVKLGMGSGLIRDLAVGALRHGSEVQQDIGQFCVRASIGAPPDPFAPQGQDWGLVPMDPIKLQQHDYQHFIDLVRSNMAHCGALRMDHVMAMLRLWWIPLDKQFGQGAYIYYAVDIMLAILCLESHRAKAGIIGEDLGVVPPEIVKKLHDAGVVSNELFYFCKDWQGFKSPEHYKPYGLMMLANHDVPTLSAWWQGEDLQLRHQLELIDQQELAQANQARAQEREEIFQKLKNHGLLETFNTTEELDYFDLLNALISFVGQGQSLLFSVQLSDLSAELQPVNIPGTWREFPNWQRRQGKTVKQLAQSKVIKHILTTLAEVRG